MIHTAAGQRRRGRRRRPATSGGTVAAGSRSPTAHSRPGHHGHQHHHAPGAFHRQSHDVLVLEKWLDDTREAGRKTPATTRARARVQDVCAEELFNQTALGSPKIAAMLRRVWAERSALLSETLRLLEHQTAVRDYAQTELMTVTRSAGLHAERTRRVGSQWEIQRAAVMEKLRDTEAELHSVGIERNQLRRECEQLRAMMTEYIRGAAAVKGGRAIKHKHKQKQGAGSAAGASAKGSDDPVEDEEQKRREAEDEAKFENDSDEEDLGDRAIRARADTIRAADRRIDALLLEMMSEKRVQKAALRGGQKLLTRFLSGMQATSLGLKR